MSDRRLTPANARVALAGTDAGTGAKVVAGAPRRVVRALTDIKDAPGGKRDRQLVFGARVTLIEDRGGWAFVQAQRDGYVGYVESGALGPDAPATHRVKTRATHLYEADNIKSPDLTWLPHGAEVEVTGESGVFWQTPGGFIPKGHLARIGDAAADPVDVARLFLGTPYLWGGNSPIGIDCSGLVQAALMAAGHDCPADSDLQQASVGADLAATAPLQRGDLIFWKGHVALCVSAQSLIHANAHNMAVTEEPVEEAITRIAAAGDGPVTRRARP